MVGVFIFMQMRAFCYKQWKQKDVKRKGKWPSERNSVGEGCETRKEKGAVSGSGGQDWRGLRPVAKQTGLKERSVGEEW